MTRIIDTHQHLWQRDIFQLPWIESGSVLDRDFTIADYEEEAEGLGVAKTIYMEVDVAEGQQAEEAEWAATMCRRPDNAMVGAVIGGRPASPDFSQYLDRAARSPQIKGVRQVLHGASTPPGYCLQPAFIDGVRRLGERDLSFDLCMRAGELLDAAKLIDACPNTFFILDHCGNPLVTKSDQTDWFRDIAEVARRENIICKISGIVASANRGEWNAQTLAPFVHRCAEMFGADRIVFGGDWPVCHLAASLREWLEALREITKTWSADERRKLYSDNAVLHYRLAAADESAIVK